jgi:hypothetical protein
MEVKQAARIAIDYVRKLFDEEGTSNLGLEEIEFLTEPKTWQVTVGFSRPWDYPKPHEFRTTLLQPYSPHIIRPRRSYKTVLVDDESGAVVSVRNRPVEEELAS